jgi:GTP-binding protein EngB required for normal cell division
MSDILRVVDGLDLVVELSEGVVHPDDVTRARQTALQTRHRGGYLGGTLVMAIVGGTGSGKSSLLNALAGERVASVSPVRPHTNRPLAWIPEDGGSPLDELLDRLEVDERVVHRRFPGLALLDATDFDSIDRDHRARLERLLPEIDGIIWVFDPEKYHDPAIHDEFIAPLADSAPQFVFVLNQIDRIDERERLAIADDLRATLVSDGIAEPVLFFAAADPPDGRPRGVDLLAGFLENRLDAKRVQMGAVLGEARRVAAGLASAAGVAHGGSLAFEERWSPFVTAAVSALSANRGPGVVNEVLCGLEDLVGHLAVEAGGVFAQKLRGTFPPNHLEEVLGQALARAAGAPDRDTARRVLADHLQVGVGGPLREILWERAALSASLAGFVVDAEAAQQALQR